MQLVITDSSIKVGVLKSAYPGAQVVAVDFPLYARFSKNGKVKYDVWPKLKPVAKGKIESLITNASKCSQVVAVFDNSAYGRSLARDIREALSAVNAQVSFLFPDILSKDEIRCCDNSGVPDEPDVKYVADRMITQRMNALIEEAVPVYAEIELTRQQAFVLSSVYGSSSLCDSLSFTDKIGRVWRGSPGKVSKTSVVMKNVINKLDAFPVFGCPHISLERTWSAVEKLQAMGLIPTNECQISDDAFYRWTSYAASLGFKPRTLKSKERVYWVDDPGFDSNNIVDEMTARPLYRWLRNMTLMMCLEPEAVVKLEAKAGCMSLNAFIDDGRESWMKMTDTQVSKPYAPDEEIRQDLCIIDPQYVSASMILEDCKDHLSQREIWSSLLMLHRRNLIKQRYASFYPTSRGAGAIFVLKEVLPIALGKALSNVVAEVEATENPKDRVAVLDEAFNAHAVTKDITVWEAFTKGAATVTISRSSAFFTTKGGSYVGLAVADGLTKPILPNKSLALNCKCGSTVVKTQLDATYEPQFVCESCKKEYPLTTLKQMGTP